MEFSDYVIFADESGDHGLETIDPQFPAFALIFCVFRKDEYNEVIEPEIRRLKYKYFGHDAVILHEREVRKQIKPFDFLRSSKEFRDAFYGDIGSIMAAMPFQIFASIIKKEPFSAKYKTPWNPYEVAMHFCLEKVCEYLRSQGQEQRRVHVLFEARGKAEDQKLELEFRRITSNQRQWGWKRVDFSVCEFEPIFVPKAANMAGHQISDLIARPMALRALNPFQENRAFDVFRAKIGYMKTFP